MPRRGAAGHHDRGTGHGASDLSHAGSRVPVGGARGRPVRRRHSRCARPGRPGCRPGSDRQRRPTNVERHLAARRRPRCRGPAGAVHPPPKRGRRGERPVPGHDGRRRSRHRSRRAGRNAGHARPGGTAISDAPDCEVARHVPARTDHELDGRADHGHQPPDDRHHRVDGTGGPVAHAHDALDDASGAPPRRRWRCRAATTRRWSTRPRRASRRRARGGTSRWAGSCRPTRSGSGSSTAGASRSSRARASAWAWWAASLRTCSRWRPRPRCVAPGRTGRSRRPRSPAPSAARPSGRTARVGAPGCRRRASGTPSSGLGLYVLTDLDYGSGWQSFRGFQVTDLSAGVRASLPAGFRGGFSVADQPGAAALAAGADGGHAADARPADLVHRLARPRRAGRLGGPVRQRPQARDRSLADAAGHVDRLQPPLHGGGDGAARRPVRLRLPAGAPAPAARLDAPDDRRGVRGERHAAARLERIRCGGTACGRRSRGGWAAGSTSRPAPTSAGTPARPASSSREGCRISSSSGAQRAARRVGVSERGGPLPRLPRPG